MKGGTGRDDFPARLMLGIVKLAFPRCPHHVHYFTISPMQYKDETKAIRRTQNFQAGRFTFSPSNTNGRSNPRLGDPGRRRRGFCTDGAGTFMKTSVNETSRSSMHFLSVSYFIERYPARSHTRSGLNILSALCGWLRTSGFACSSFGSFKIP